MAEDDRKEKGDADDAPEETDAEERADGSGVDAEAAGSEEESKGAPGDEASAGDEGEGEGDEEDEYLPTQLAHRRYVYAVFFALGIAVAYFASKAGFALWHRLSQWTPKVGEPREDVITPIAAVISAIATFVIYRRENVRTLSDEVALELSKVEWPSRDRVRRSTSIVVGATLGSSLAFWLYDIGTNKAVTFVTSSDHPVLYGLVAGVIIYVVRAIGVRYLVGTS
jgi:preprotein translocase SecE subunit